MFQKVTKQKKMSSNAFNASIATVRSVAEALDVNVNKGGVAELLAQETEYRIKEYITPASYIMNFTNTQTLTAKHINEVLEMQGFKPLIGYSDHGIYDVSEPQVLDGRIFYIMRDSKVPLETILREQIEPPNRPKNIATETKFINGVKIASKTSTSGLVRNIRKRIPITSIFGSVQADSSDSLLKDSQTEENSNTDLSSDQIHFYQTTVDNVSTSNNIKETLKMLEKYAGINALIPYFLHFFISQIAQNLDSYSIMQNIGLACLSIASNPSSQIDFYAHPLCHIGTTLSLKQIITGAPDEDCRIRDIGTNIVSLVAERCRNSFPSCSLEFFNNYLNYLFDESASYVPIAYGALSGIFSLGEDAYVRILPHLKHLVKWSLQQKNFESHSALFRKKIYDEVVQANTNNVKPEESKRIVDFIDSIS